MSHGVVVDSISEFKKLRRVSSGEVCGSSAAFPSLFDKFTSNSVGSLMSGINSLSLFKEITPPPIFKALRWVNFKPPFSKLNTIRRLAADN